MNSSATRNIIPLNRDMLEQLSHLCVLLEAANNACMKRDGVKYAMGDSGGGTSVTEFQKFLSKLALICDSERGKATMTAMVCLKGTDGPEYVFASNSRKQMELEATKEFISTLLDYVSKNPETLQLKALQKRVLWRILEFGFGKLRYYLAKLDVALGHCINDCEQTRPASKYHC